MATTMTQTYLLLNCKWEMIVSVWRPLNKFCQIKRLTTALHSCVAMSPLCVGLRCMGTSASQVVPAAAPWELGCFSDLNSCSGSIFCGNALHIAFTTGATAQRTSVDLLRILEMCAESVLVVGASFWLPLPTASVFHMYIYHGSSKRRSPS